MTASAPPPYDARDYPPPPSYGTYQQDYNPAPPQVRLVICNYSITINLKTFALSYIYELDKTTKATFVIVSGKNEQQTIIVCGSLFTLYVLLLAVPL